MKRAARQKDFDSFRRKYPHFSFSDYRYSVNDNGIELKFLFEIPGLCTFEPTMFFRQPGSGTFDTTNTEMLDNFAFHIGMTELISYWKTTCSPNVHITKHLLNSKQINWWKKLYFHGLGEFFYLNSINTDIHNFMNITSEGYEIKSFNIDTDKSRILVPVGGGKDSAVTLEVLKSLSGYSLVPFAVNPREAVVRTIEIAGYSMENSLVVHRTLDKNMLDLNAKGFLNGHTPFSALLAFVSSFSAALTGTGYIALSNENSANESTVPGTKINHQYSKSFEFEQDFYSYLKKHITPDIHYFSFLRPLNELQIASLFARFKQHHLSFRSCNVGSKTDSWCGKCPKCLFTAIILSPFLKQEEIRAIFRKDIFSDRQLKPVLDELTGTAEIKPFECVGTPDEVNIALNKTLGKTAALPPLLHNYPVKTAGIDDAFDRLLHNIHNEHNVPEELLIHLKKVLNA